MFVTSHQLKLCYFRCKFYVMKSKALILIAVLLAILMLIGVYFNHAMRLKSPVVENTIATDTQEISVKYCSPSVRGRVVFGDEHSLQPFGSYWRLGANEMTTITFSDDVMIGDHAVPKGTYGLYAIPYEDAFEIRLNKEHDRWGYSEPDYTQDILREKVETYRRDQVVEQLHMDFEEHSSNSIVLMMEWEYYRWYVPIERLN